MAGALRLPAPTGYVNGLCLVAGALCLPALQTEAYIFLSRVGKRSAPTFPLKPCYFFICPRIAPHWFSLPSDGEISASSAAAGVTSVASAAATAPRAISGPGFTP